MFHQNVQGLSNCLNNIFVVISNLDLQFVAITEHWQNTDSIGAFQLQCFKLVTYFCRRKSRAHGGVALYCANYLSPVIRHDINQLSEEYVFECTAAEFRIDSVGYVVCVIYKPPDTSTEDFILRLDQLLDIASEGEKFVLVARDFNLDLLPLNKNDKNINTLNSFLNLYNMKYIINSPTRVTANTKSCLDNVYIPSFADYTVNVLNTDISDHFGQAVTIFNNIQTANNTYAY